MHSSVPERIRPALAALWAACLALAVALCPSVTLAAGTLTGGDVSPNGGSTATEFLFSVDYSTSNDVADIWVEVGATRVDLVHVDESGTYPSGTYQQASSIGAGTHAVTFFADVNGPGVETFAVADLVVAAGPTPTPGPTPPPTPTPSPTPLPTATPVPTPTPTPLPPGVTPRPTPRPTPLPPGVTPRPATPMPEESEAAVSVSAEPSDSGDPHPSETAAGEQSASAYASASAAPTPPPSGSPDVGSERGGFGQVGWIVLGGMTSVAGAAVLGRQWWMRRRA